MGKPPQGRIRAHLARIPDGSFIVSVDGKTACGLTLSCTLLSSKPCVLAESFRLTLRGSIFSDGEARPPSRHAQFYRAERRH